MPVRHAVGRTTRDYLKAETAQGHERLDKRLGALVMGDAPDYERFIDIQFRARLGVERWLAATGGLDLPPSQTDLLAEDLFSLGREPGADAPDLDIPADCDPLGVCWVLAGSSMGNRAIHARLAKRDGRLPMVFLADERMKNYWAKLRPLLERGHDPEQDRPVLIAAQATFAHFNAVAIERIAIESA
ncbi:biliverdin-producing heme oxygenase [Qipengyuania qiaonensis]|uniref:Biliverdin-producing heme oxygenase n=1 Tax=Qipengyuania qiaonensis TaxID=2867240 RepID=A0ABS7JD40_9SPHN|nr:biliverdin-producing heme oxygenase [Qipengyuania qiaonensis]MBX7482892.1 biliverdin-producing heme oxygenase [Qipengyuania qiaonensis]